MNADQKKEKRMYDETQDAGKMLEEIIQSRGKRPSPSGEDQRRSQTESEGTAKAAGKTPEESVPAGEEAAAPTPGSPAEEATLASGARGSGQPSPEGEKKTGEAPVGMLFSKLAKMSRGKIRPVPDSIGWLFRKYTQKRT